MKSYSKVTIVLAVIFLFSILAVERVSGQVLEVVTIATS